MPARAVLRARVAGLLAAAALPGVSCGLAGGGTIERHVDARDHVVGVVPLPLADAHRLLAERLPATVRSDAAFAGLSMAAAGDAIVPDADQLRLRAADDPALAAYAQLPPAARSQDFYLFDLSDRSWQTAEYTRDSAPLRFKTDFIVHLEGGEGGTAVEVIEYLPRLLLGKTFRLRGHHGPDFYQDIRFVAPTTQDRVHLLEIVRRALARP